MGIGRNIDAVNTSVMNLLDDIKKDGILKMSFGSSYEKRYYKLTHQYPTPYSEIGLEIDYKNDVSLWCDLTFWAVQFLHLYNNTERIV